MPSKVQLQWYLELVWLVFSLLALALVLYPIYSSLSDYPFFVINSLFIVTFITLTRYIFLLPYTFLAHRQRLKAALFFVSIPFVFYLIQGIHTFNEYVDYGNLEHLVNQLPSEKQDGMQRYIQNEMLLFGVGSVVSAIVLPFRLLLSVWRLRNKGQV